MGFWSNLIQGKPAFEVPPTAPADNSTGSSDTPPTGASKPAESASPFVDQSGKKIIPQVSIENVKSRLSGGSFTTTAWIKNLSNLEIELDKIIVLSTKREIDLRLKPQEAREATLYSGPAPDHDHDHKAMLQYRIVANGDYFSAEYMVEFHYESGVYTVEEFHPTLAARDV